MGAGDFSEDNTVQIKGIEVTIGVLMDHACGIAYRTLLDSGIEPDEGAVKSLAVTMLATGAEIVAGGNAARPAFKHYLNTAITLLENALSPFARRGRRG